MRKIISTLILLLFLIVGALPAFAQQQTGFIHTVQAGETLGSIAIRYNIPINSLITANNLFNPNTIYAGQALFIPSTFGTGGPTATIPVVTPIPTIVTRNYTVQPGDTLTAIANRYNISVDELARMNDIVFAGAIRRGQVIMVPDTPINLGSGGGPNDAIGGPLVQQPTIPVIAAPRQHTVQIGDYVEYLALIYGTTPQAIAAANNLSNVSRIFPGDVLIIP